MQIGKDTQAVFYAKKIDTIYSKFKTLSDSEQHLILKHETEIFRILSLLFRIAGNSDKMIEYLHKHHEVAPDNDTTISGLMYFYLRSHKPELAIEYANKITHSELQKLYKLFMEVCFKKKPIAEILVEYDLKELIKGTADIDPNTCIEVMLRIISCRQNVADMIEAASKVLNRQSDYPAINNLIRKNDLTKQEVIKSCLTVCIELGEYDQGYEFLEKYKAHTFNCKHNLFTLKKYEYALLEFKGQFNRAVKYVKQGYVGKELNIDIKLLTATHFMICKKFDLASRQLDCLEKAVLTTSQELTVYLYRYIISTKSVTKNEDATSSANNNQVCKTSKLEKKTDTSNAQNNKPTSKELKEVPSECPAKMMPKRVVETDSSLALLDLISSKEEFEDMLPKLSPKAIHTYFQRIKKQQTQRILDQKPKEAKHDDNAKWNVGETIYQASADDIVKIAGKTGYFACIAAKISNSLDPSILTKYQKALNKGFAQNGHNGLKLICHKVLELKINADKRLYTNKYYVSGNSKLFIFDHAGNHETVKRAVNENPYDIIHPIDASCDDLCLAGSDGELT